MLENSTTNS